MRKKPTLVPVGTALTRPLYWLSLSVEAISNHTLPRICPGRLGEARDLELSALEHDGKFARSRYITAIGRIRRKGKKKLIEFQVFDALVYLVPGTILVASLVFCMTDDFLGRLALKPDTFLGIIAFGVLAFSIGFFVHLVSGPVFVLLNKIIFGMSPLHHVTDVFTERQDMLVLKSDLEKQLGVKTDDFTDLYRYATYAVISSDNPLASRIDRLQSLALMSRNLTTTIPTTALVLFVGLRLWKREKWVLWIPLGLSPIIALVLHYGAWQFSVATVLATYRSIILIY